MVLCVQKSASDRVYFFVFFSLIYLLFVTFFMLVTGFDVFCAELQLYALHKNNKLNEE